MRLLLAEIGPRYSDEAARREEKKGLNDVAAPLLPLLPENVAVQRVIFIANEINNACHLRGAQPPGGW